MRNGHFYAVNVLDNEGIVLSALKWCFVVSFTEISSNVNSLCTVRKH